MSQEKVFQVGGVELHVDNRAITGDGGPSVRVYGDVDGEADTTASIRLLPKRPTLPLRSIR